MLVDMAVPYPPSPEGNGFFLRQCSDRIGQLPSEGLMKRGRTAESKNAVDPHAGSARPREENTSPNYREVGSPIRPPSRSCPGAQ
jgi:hypothetical protein